MSFKPVPSTTQRLKTATAAISLTLLLSSCQHAPTAPASQEGDLASRWSSLKSSGQHIPTRDAAVQLGVTEAQLLATQVGREAIRLQNGPDAARAIMARVLDIGEIRAATRNADALIETTGVPKKLGPVKPRGSQTMEQAQEQRKKYERITAGGYIGGPVDLRFDFDEWAYAFAVTQPGRGGKTSRSLQFFDAQGNSVHKVYLTQDDSIANFDQIVADFKATGAAATQTSLTVQPAQAPKAELPDAQIDVAGYRKAWQGITDVHQFHGIQEKFKVSREQALRLAPEGAARKLSDNALQRLIDGAVKQQVPIMAFVGNTGLTHVYSGTLKDAQVRGEWLVATEPGVRLLLRQKTAATGWVATRGGVTSVDFFDASGKPVVTFFGERIGSDHHVTPAWKTLVDQL